MFKKSVCILYCDKSYTESASHESNILSKIEKLTLLQNVLNQLKIDKFSFKNLIKSLPAGTIFSKSTNEEKIYVSLPFFSSHLKMPVKNGELIWIYEDNSEENKNKLVNSYWISRVHGLIFSEDLNYTHNIRDNLINVEEIFNNKDIKNYFFSLPVNSDLKFENNFKIENSISLNDNIKNYNVPRYFSDNSDFSIQGSNNTLITLTTNKSLKGRYKDDSIKKSGQVIISAGRGKYFSDNQEKVFIETKDIDKAKKFAPNNPPSFYLKNNNKESTLSNSIQNKTKSTENFKLSSIYTSKENKKSISRNLNEGAIFLKKDASSIIVSETFNTELFSQEEKFKMKSFKDLQVLEEIDSKKSLNIKNNISNKKVKRFNTFNKLSIKNNSIPFAGIYSSNIKLIARNDSSYDPTFSDGSIYLIKDSKEKKEYGEISLREDGNIILNGRKILIGDYEREINKNNGEGSTVILGAHGELNSAVLGENLVSLLCELIEINKTSLKLLSKSLQENKQNFDLCNDNFNSINIWANSHLHNATGPASPVTPVGLAGTPSQNPEILKSDINDDISKKIINKKDPNLLTKLDDLIINIDKILSKFVKTS